MEYVNEKTLVGEIVSSYPETIGVLLSCGMHCLGCAAASNETIEEACMVHDIDPDAFVDAVNGFLAGLPA